MATEDTKSSAVYVAWPTFRNALGLLADALPNRIDKTVFGTKAGAVQSQLVTGLKFLGLIARDGKPTDALRALAVKDEAERKRQMAKVLKASYPSLFALDLTKTTPEELKEEMSKSYGVSGDTTERAIRFFIAAAEYAGISLSAYVSRGSGAVSNGGSTTRRRRMPRKKADRTIPPAGGRGAETGESVSIQVSSGGTLTLSTAVKWPSLSPKDRAFVYGLIDQLNEYAQQGERKEEGHEEPES